MIFLLVALTTLPVSSLVADNITEPNINSHFDGTEVDFQSPPPRIVYFKAEPPEISEGGTSLLKWKTENAKSVSISGIGTVTPVDRGYISVRPIRETNYELTVTNDSGQSVEERTKITVMMSLR